MLASGTELVAYSEQVNAETLEAMGVSAIPRKCIGGGERCGDDGGAVGRGSSGDGSGGEA